MSAKTGFLKRFWKPVAATGVGGTAVIIWFEEMLLFAQEIMALVLLPIMAGIIYLLDILMFKSRKPHREDGKDLMNKN